MLPEGWRNTIISEACELINGRGFKPHEWSRKGLPIIRIQNLNGSQEYNFYSGEFDKKILVQDGQLLFAWSGSKGTSFGPHIWNGPNGLLNYHTWKVLPKPSANILFLNQYFRYITSHIENKSHGASALVHTQKGEMENISILLPPLLEQKKIAAILSTWDRAIEGTEKLLANSQQQKKALMQQLLTGKKRLPGFTGEWKRQSFKMIFDVDNQKDTQTPASEYKEEGSIPIVDQGKSFISGYTDTNTFYENVPVIIFGDHTRVIKWVDFPFSPGADGTQVLRTRARTLNKFGYYLLQNVDLPNLGYSRHMKELKEQIFHLPPLPEQKAIAAVLSAADEEITAIESDLSRLRQEKKALMQQLLTGKRRVKVD